LSARGSLEEAARARAKAAALVEGGRGPGEVFPGNPGGARCFQPVCGHPSLLRQGCVTAERHGFINQRHFHCPRTATQPLRLSLADSSLIHLPRAGGTCCCCGLARRGRRRLSVPGSCVSEGLSPGTRRGCQPSAPAPAERSGGETWGLLVCGRGFGSPGAGAGGQRSALWRVPAGAGAGNAPGAPGALPIPWPGWDPCRCPEYRRGTRSCPRKGGRAAARGARRRRVGAGHPQLQPPEHGVLELPMIRKCFHQSARLVCALTSGERR